MLPISVCIIAKNEEKYLEKCLQSLVPYGFEIILADTGSTDMTLVIARKYTHNIYHFEWCDDFSAARNFSIAQASHDWILILDCDEFIHQIDIPALTDSMNLHPASIGRITIKNLTSAAHGNAVQIGHISRFFSRKHYQFTGSIHEQLVSKEDSISSDIISSYHTSSYFDAPISITHLGYLGSKEELEVKSLRNAHLLEEALAADNSNPYLYYQLGQTYMKLEDYERACLYLEEGLSLPINPQYEYVQTMVESLGYCLLETKHFRAALSFLDTFAEFAVTADFFFLSGLIYMNNAFFPEAIEAFLTATAIPRFSVLGVNSFSAYYNIGLIHECNGNISEAITYYQKCGNFPPAIDRLSVILG